MYRIYSVKQRPRINAAFYSRNINKRRPRINARQDAAFIRIIDSKGTPQSLLPSQLAILSEPDIKPFCMYWILFTLCIAVVLTCKL